MEREQESVEVDQLGLLLNLPAVPLKVSAPKAAVRTKPEVIRLDDPEPPAFTLRGFWEVHGIRYQPSPKVARSSDRKSSA